MKKAEDEEMKRWTRMKRFEKIEKLRQEQNFTNTRPKILDSAWEIKLKNKSTAKEKITTPKKLNENEKKIFSASMPVGGEEGGGDSKLSPTPRETTLQNILRRKLENKKFIPPPKQSIVINPSWSGTRMKRKFLRRMDKVFHGINFLGMIEEGEGENAPPRIGGGGQGGMFSDGMVEDEKVQYPECPLSLPPPKLGEGGQGGVLFGGMIREEEIQNPECQLPPPNIGEGGQGGALFGRTVRDTPTDTDRTVLPTDFNEMTTEYTTESLLDYQNCYLVI